MTHLYWSSLILSCTSEENVATPIWAFLGPMSNCRVKSWTKFSIFWKFSLVSLPEESSRKTMSDSPPPHSATGNKCPGLELFHYWHAHYDWWKYREMSHKIALHTLTWIKSHIIALHTLAWIMSHLIALHTLTWIMSHIIALHTLTWIMSHIIALHTLTWINNRRVRN